MNYIIDVSGKVPYYEHALCVELSKELDGDMCLVTPYPQEIYGPSYKVKKLIRFFPNKRDTLPSAIKALECLINYCYLLLFVAIKRDIKVLHFQWLPLLEHNSIEKGFVKIIRYFCKGKMLLTIHNVYPHDIPEEQKPNYIKRFRDVTKPFNLFVTHNESSKKQLVDEFGIEEDRVSVVHHGVFIPDYRVTKKATSDIRQILMFGVQSLYKGTDILINSIGELTDQERTEIYVVIAGKSDSELYNQYRTKAEQLGINWINRFIEEEELNQLIVDSDLVVFPYREISQSGALLLSMYYKRAMILSDLPAFKETLRGYPEKCFFRNEQAAELTNCLRSFIAGDIDVEYIEDVLSHLCEEYSWVNSARKTIRLYTN